MPDSSQSGSRWRATVLAVACLVTALCSTVAGLYLAFDVEAPHVVRVIVGVGAIAGSLSLVVYAAIRRELETP